MKVNVRTLEGADTGKQVELKKQVFGIEPHDHAVYMAIKAELAHARQGSASSKTRGEKRGSGRKLWRQKGTGRARVGGLRSPIRRGGGPAFGPKPRNFGLKINRKMRTLARKSVLSATQSEGRIIVVEALELEGPRTRSVVDALGALGVAGKRVMVLPGTPTNHLWLAVRNIPGVRVKAARDVSTFDVWAADYLLVDQAGVQDLNTALGA
ncbi:MAG: 50S ribosomal protein L4 [Candidatus Neomarinimicrobiota bacterium]